MAMADSRTVRARIDAELATNVDAAMEYEGRTESDIVRRALKAYLVPRWIPAPGSVAVGGKVFRGSDPK